MNKYSGGKIYHFQWVTWLNIAMKMWILNCCQLCQSELDIQAVLRNLYK